MTPFEVINKALKELGEIKFERPPVFYCGPWVLEAIRDANLYAPQMRAFRAISRGEDPRAARYAFLRMRELTAHTRRA